MIQCCEEERRQYLQVVAESNFVSVFAEWIRLEEISVGSSGPTSLLNHSGSF